MLFEALILFMRIVIRCMMVGGTSGCKRAVRREGRTLPVGRALGPAYSDRNRKTHQRPSEGGEAEFVQVSAVRTIIAYNVH